MNSDYLSSRLGPLAALAGATRPPSCPLAPAFLNTVEVADARSPLSLRTEEEHRDGLPERIGALLGGIIFDDYVRSGCLADFKAPILAWPTGRVTAWADAMN